MQSLNIPDEVKVLNISFSSIVKAQKEENIKKKFFLKEIETKYFDQVEIEKRFLDQNRWVCPPSVEASILEKLDNQDTKLSIMDNGKKNNSMLLDIESLNYLACLAQNIVMFDVPNFRSGYNFVKKLITDLRLIGRSSENGIVMRANLYDKYKNMLVIKAPKNPGKYSDASVNHEVAVGKILNSLRSIIPNFAFLLGSFDCGPPIFKPNSDKLISWCRSGLKVKYIMYENVSNAISFFDYSKECSAQDYLDFLLQITHALMIAYKQVGFTHYDLHGENVLVKTVEGHEDGFYLPYSGDFIYAKKLAMIIDYGSSHVYLPENSSLNTKDSSDKISLGIKSDGGPKYNLEYIDVGIYIDKPFPAHDCYRFLSSTLHYMSKVNPKVYEKLKGLLYFFYSKDENNLDKILNNKDSSYIVYYGSKEYMEKIQSFTFENFIKYCREYCLMNDFNDPVVSGREYTSELDEHILFSPNSNMILSPYPKSEIELKNRINNIEEIFDMIEPLTIFKKHLDDKRDTRSFAREKINSYNEVLDKIFDIFKVQKNIIIDIVNKEIDELNEEMSNLSFVTYRSIPHGDVYNLRSSVALSEYMNSFEKSMNYLDKMDEIEKKIEMLKYIDSILTYTFETKINNLKSIFDHKDERNIILNFVRKDANKMIDYLEPKYPLDQKDENIELILDNLLYTLPDY